MSAWRKASGGVPHTPRSSAENSTGGWASKHRMHLTREQVAELLPLLQHFADTGELP